IEWSVSNLGVATTLSASWDEDVWLSADTQLQPDIDILLAKPGHGGALRAGESYHRSLSPTLPNGLAGTYFVLVRTDPLGLSGDANPANNVRASTPGASPPGAPPDPVTITAVPPPDLVVSSLEAPNKGDAGQPVRLKWTIRNQGPG